jgi:hypothetical protein
MGVQVCGTEMAGVSPLAGLCTVILGAARKCAYGQSTPGNFLNIDSWWRRVKTLCGMAQPQTGPGWVHGRSQGSFLRRSGKSRSPEMASWLRRDGTGFRPRIGYGAGSAPDDASQDFGRFCTKPSLEQVTNAY